MVKPTRKHEPSFPFGTTRSTGRVEVKGVGDLGRPMRPTKMKIMTITKVMTRTPKKSIKMMRTLKTFLKRIPQETLSRMEFPTNWSHH